jgi:hypothetical protein
MPSIAGLIASLPRSRTSRILILVAAVAGVVSMATTLVLAFRPTQDVFPVETGWIQNRETSPAPDVLPRAPDEFTGRLSRIIQDDSKRFVVAFDASGSKDPLVLVVYNYPSRLRQGDDGQLLLDITSRNSDDQSLVLEIASTDLSVAPVTIAPVPIAGNTHAERRVILSPRSSGNKSFVIMPTLVPSRGAIPPGPGHIDVLPAATVLGIAEPYLEICRSVSSIIGLPTILAALLAGILARQRAKKRRGPSGHGHSASDANKVANPSEEHGGGTEDEVGDRTGPGAGYDEEPETVKDKGGVS